MDVYTFNESLSKLFFEINEIIKTENDVNIITMKKPAITFRILINV